MSSKQPVADQKGPKWTARSASHSSLQVSELVSGDKSTNSAPQDLKTPPLGSILSKSSNSSSTTTTSSTTNRQRLVKLKKHASFASSAIIISGNNEQSSNNNNNSSSSSSRTSVSRNHSGRFNLTSGSGARYGSISSPPLKTSGSIGVSFSKQLPDIASSNMTTRTEASGSATQPNSNNNNNSSSPLSSVSLGGLKSAIVNNYASNKQLSVDSLLASGSVNKSCSGTPDTSTTPLNPLAKTLLANKKLGPSLRLGLRRRRALTMDSDQVTKGKRGVTIREKLSGNCGKQQTKTVKQTSCEQYDRNKSFDSGDDYDQNNDDDDDDDEDDDEDEDDDDDDDDDDDHSDSSSDSTSSHSTSGTTTDSTNNNRLSNRKHSDYSSYHHDEHMAKSNILNSKTTSNTTNNRNNGASSGSYCYSDSCITETVLDDDGLEVTDIDSVRLDHEDYQYLLKCMRGAQLNDDDDNDNDNDNLDEEKEQPHDKQNERRSSSRKDQQQPQQQQEEYIVEERRHSDVYNVGAVDSEKISDRLTKSICLADSVKDSVVDSVVDSKAQQCDSASQQPSPDDNGDQLQLADQLKSSPNSNVTDKRTTRADYAWYPPNLNLTQIREFFQQFSVEKVPYKGSVGALNRDKQICYQLPKQDISSDYCEYLEGEASLRAFQEFVNVRNVVALDVAHIVEINKSTWNTKMSCGGDAANQSQQQEQQLQQSCDNRKSSIISQSSLMMDTAKMVATSNIMTNIKCRRCLMRIELGQLAVVAPKFLIGITSEPTTLLSLQQQLQMDTPSNGNHDCHQQPISTSQFVGGVCTEATNYSQVGLFHPKCFTCSTCREFLVDLVYCIKDNKLYCLRHYGDRIRPRCGTCQELIFADEYSKAMSEDYHVDHFICRHCNQNLAGQRYVLKEEQPYCTSCFEVEFAHICEDCRKPIGLDSRDLCYKDKHWHDSCFVCHKCNQSLVDKPFGSKSDHVYCAHCYETNFSTRCHGCDNPFRAGSKKMEYRGRQWHDSCFCCCVCKNTIGSSSFIPKNEAIYCIKCYEDKYATRCTKCKNVITSGGVTFRNEPWHRECFNCHHCNKSLAGQRFTTRDNVAQLTDSKTGSDQQQTGSSSGSSATANNQTTTTTTTTNAYCVDCYGQLFAKRCFACSQAITGFGGTKYVTFEDRNWHNDCFLCTDCHISLIGKGFIIDGPDAILCGECAQAKLRSN